MSYPAPPEERMTWKTRFLRFATWWTGATINTRVWTSRFGEIVGYDEFGNAYYRTVGGSSVWWCSQPYQPGGVADPSLSQR